MTREFVYDMNNTHMFDFEPSRVLANFFFYIFYLFVYKLQYCLINYKVMMSQLVSLPETCYKLIVVHSHD